MAFSVMTYIVKDPRGTYFNSVLATACKLQQLQSSKGLAFNDMNESS